LVESAVPLTDTHFEAQRRVITVLGTLTSAGWSPSGMARGSSQAGNGGAGGDGGSSIADGSGGTVDPNNGCSGGNGGQGGARGAAGRISAGILYSGTTPTIDTDTTFNAGSTTDLKGTGGLGGTSGAPSLAAGETGTAGALYAILRAGQMLVFQEADPALILYSRTRDISGTHRRHHYLGGMAGLCVWVGRKRTPHASRASGEEA